MLPLVGGGRPGDRADDLRVRFRRLGRSLGRVRDADVRLALLTLLETRVPHAAAALVVLRQDRERERQKLMRKLIKRVERLDVDRLLRSLADDVACGLRAWPWEARSRVPWRRRLRGTLAERAQTAADAIVHATGIYFPRRLHDVRIAAKKLRYAVEIADAVQVADSSATIRDLKKAQDLLGEMHDRQDLIDELKDPDVIESADTPSADVSHQVNLIRQVLEAECRRLHEQYLDRRARLLGICDGYRLVPRVPVAVAVPIVAAGALALSSGLYVARRRLGPAIAH